MRANERGAAGGRRIGDVLRRLCQRFRRERRPVRGRPVADAGARRGAEPPFPASSDRLGSGRVWDEGLSIRASGNAASPISFIAFGVGSRPTIRNAPAGMWAAAVDVFGEYVVVDGLLVRDAHEAGVELHPGADHTVVRDVEATAVGEGFAVSSRYNLLTRNYAHDLTMIVDTPGGDDDYGAVVSGWPLPTTRSPTTSPSATAPTATTMGPTAVSPRSTATATTPRSTTTGPSATTVSSRSGPAPAGGAPTTCACPTTSASRTGSRFACTPAGASTSTSTPSGSTTTPSSRAVAARCCSAWRERPAPGALIVRNNIFATNGPIDRDRQLHPRRQPLPDRCDWLPARRQRERRRAGIRRRGGAEPPAAARQSGDRRWSRSRLRHRLSSVATVPQGGAPDIGAFEFRTGSSDTTDPR